MYIREEMTMSEYQSYFLMKPEDAPAYVQAKLNYFPEGHRLAGTEIGDGNINYVFRVVDQDTGKSNFHFLNPLPFLIPPSHCFCL